jgi:hypothetical protein
VKKAAFIYHSYSIPLKYVSKREGKGLRAKKENTQNRFFILPYIHPQELYVLCTYAYICVCVRLGAAVLPPPPLLLLEVCVGEM